MAAIINSVTVHECDGIYARAERAMDDLSTTWLELRFGPSFADAHISIFMDYDRAARIAAAINAADQPQSIQIEHMPAAAE